MRLGEILIKRGVITEEQLNEALNLQREKKGRLGEHLIKLKYAKERDILVALSQQTGIPFQDKLSIDDIVPEFIEKISINYAKKNHVLPVKINDSCAIVAISDPLDIFTLDDVSHLLGMPVSPVLVSPAVIEDAINKVYDRTQSTAEKMMDDLEEESLDVIAHELEEPTDILEATDEAPIIRLVNSLLYQAVKERASDIHIEPFEKDLSVRFRVDGILHEIIRPPKRFQSSIISRVKIMAKLNIAEKRLPQDGRIRVKIAGKDIDIRISTVPTTFGERVVMRLLDRSTVLYGLNEIGLSPEKLSIVEKLLQRNDGIILVTGPTGSGKTTTLYAFLNKKNSPDINIITIEDPVEYQLKGIGQIQVNPKIDLTFANGLRSILRQDPDVIMVGEIRDLETAEIAIHASLTGHLVFSTLHTNDSAGAVTRLIDMGIEPFLISSSLVAVIAQRLVRVLCPHCAEEYVPDEEELTKLYAVSDSRKKIVVKRARGCSECMNTGYKGRTGIYELLLIDDDIRSLIIKKTDSNTIKSLAIKKGMDTLKVDGIKKVLKGITTMEEVLRVTQEEIV
ncbi:MAG: type II secretion system ATPase GspE [Halobacteria archaeon]